PEQVQEAVLPVVAHRVILDPQMRFSGKSAEDVLKDTLAALPVPV
ncbi:MAG: AAA family ATPase, partial [Gammaproteobacteria bacterium]